MSSLRQKFSQYISPILYVDFFSITPSQRITFENKQTFKTNLGMLASWIVLTISILTFLNFGSNMIYRNNPQSVVSQIVTSDPENFQLTPDNFFFAFGLQDLRNRSQHYIDDSVYTVQVIKRTKIGTNITLQYLNASRCRLDLVPDIDELKKYYSSNQINNLICIQNYTEIIPELRSTWDGPLYKNILINIIPCKNTTDNKNSCKSSDVIQGFFNNGNFAIYFTNLALDPSNYEKPITTFAKQLYTPISYSALTYIEMLFQHLNFLTDKGLIFQEIENITSVNYVSNRQILSFNPSMAVQIDMKLDKILNIYQRKYDKVQEVGANIGGVIQILMILMGFFVSPLINLNFKTKLANSLFSFDQKLVKTAQKQNSSIRINSTKKTLTKTKTKKINIVANGNKTNSRQDSLSSSIDEPTYTEYFKSDNKKIEISYLQYIFSCIRSQVYIIKNALINKGLKQVSKTLDISYIISKLVELDKLKLLLLDKDQLHLFEYIPKPVISLDNKETKECLHKQFSSTMDKDDFEKKGEQAFKALKYIKSKTRKSDLDEKLIQMISTRIKGKNKNDKLSNIGSEDKIKEIQDFKEEDKKSRFFNNLNNQISQVHSEKTIPFKNDEIEQKRNNFFLNETNNFDKK